MDSEKHICAKKERRERTSLSLPIGIIFFCPLSISLYILNTISKSTGQRVDSTWTEIQGYGWQY
jgi:hypothetical protein